MSKLRRCHRLVRINLITGHLRKKDQVGSVSQAASFQNKKRERDKKDKETKREGDKKDRGTKKIKIQKDKET